MQGSTVVTPRSICAIPKASTLSGLASRTACPTRAAGTLGLKSSSLFGGQSLLLRGAAGSSRKSSRLSDEAEISWRSKVMSDQETHAQFFCNFIEQVKDAFHHSDKKKGKSQDVVYEGIARIAKKRLAVGNLVQADLTDGKADLDDRASERLGNHIEIQLVSVDLDPQANKPKLSPKSKVEGWLTNKGDLDLVADVDDYAISFSVPPDFGEPGAFVIQSNHKHQFFLEKLTIQAPDDSKITFNTLAWIYPKDRYKVDRVFFSSKGYLPSATPAGLREYRKQELEQTRGDGTGKREGWDRIYDYDVYNDIGNPDLNIKFKRPPLGGSSEWPYPRRMRTGRPMCKTDPKSESRTEINVPYIPSDEWFLRTKNSTFIATAIKAFAQSIVPGIKGALGNKNFEKYSDIDDLYKNGLPISVPKSELSSSDLTPEPDGKEGSLVYFNDIFKAKGDATSLINYPPPQVYKADHKAWASDVEYGRQALAGLHPTRIEIVKSYPPKSTLDPKTYGDPTSSLTDDQILPYLEGLSVAQAIERKRLFTIDHHDTILPFVEQANADTDAGFKCYAPRTIFFLNGNSQLLPVAIELSLPPKTGGKPTNKVYTPADAPDYTWSLAKLHATSIDSSIHQVLTHFTYTHGNMEPFIIATHRHLSEMHPIKSVLLPHFKDTLNINSGAREALINSGATIEKTFSTGQFSMRVGSAGYGSLWRFDHMAVPENLISRGMAKPADSSHTGSVKLVVEDYPWAKDGLEVWDALKEWISKYCEIVYKGSDQAVREDEELQAWWHEIVNVGHGDLKDRPWWPKLDSIESLAQIITIIGFTGGPFHASVNFGQYAYSGHPLNKPSGTRKFIPEKNSKDYADLQADPEKFILSTTTSSSQATIVMTVVELLAQHSVDEEYIGKPSLSTDWSTNPEIAAAFRKFSDRVDTIADNITKRNNDKSLYNRIGPAKVPYTLFYPTSTTGMTGKGVPYSTSI